MRNVQHRGSRHFRTVALLTVLAILLPNSLGSSQPQSSSYILGPEDILESSVWGYPDLTRIVIVGPDGKITVPLVGTVSSEGLSVEQLTRVLTRAYAGYIINPQVTVIVKEFRKIRVSVLGQVARPGTYTLPPGSRVLQAISAAGGIVNSAIVREVRLVLGSRLTLTLQTDALLRADAGNNPALHGGETIVVPEVNKLSASIIGQVNRPGSYELLPGTRLLDLLAVAGGVTETAGLKEAQLLRPGEPPTAVDLEQVLAGDPLANIPLRGGETLLVREDLVNIVNVTGEVARPGRYRLKGEMRLMDVLLLAGGLTEKASVTQARLARGRESQPLNLENLLVRQDMSYNIILQPGDNLFVPEEINNKFYVIGDVRVPGVFTTKGNLSVLQAIAMAGGPIQRGAATSKTAYILRRGTTPEPTLTASVAGVKVEPLANGASVVTVDLQALVRSGDVGRDVPVLAGNVVVVPQTGLSALAGIVAIISGIVWIFR